MKYKCVVVDLDQTLLHEDKSLSRETIEVFAQLPPKTEIVVATGRAITRTQRYADLIHARSMICTNGSIIYHQGQVIHRTEIDSQKVIDLIQTVRKIEPVQLTLFYPTKGYTTNEYFINKGESLRLDLDHFETVSYTHLRAHETGRNLVCRLLLEKKKTTISYAVFCLKKKKQE